VHNRWSFRTRSTWALVAAPALAVASLAVLSASPATAHVTSATPAVRTFAPHKFSMMDCNGWSPKYKSVSPTFRSHCVDPRGKVGGSSPWVFGGRTYQSNGRFMDNGHYVGHDEPTVKFISSAANSGNTMTYFMKIPTDPKASATNNGKVVDYAELSPAPWFGLPICDPGSYPQNPCTPDSDTNIGTNTPNAAGSAFMELQFYPPGFTPFFDDVSCSATHWCAAITIDSLESQFNFANINFNCEEPVNFAYLQTNGVPAGPPSPQEANLATFTPNRHTLMINPGDVLEVSITDSPTSAGLITTVKDLTTHQTGYMQASAANGFMNTNYKTCAGTPFSFHAEYATAAQQNQVPWAALQGGVLMEQEIGHSEVCNALTNKDPEVFGSITDKSVYDTCLGSTEGGKKNAGEGGCNAKGVCKNPTTEGTTGPIACPSNNFTSGQLCEFGDGACMPQGTRLITNGKKIVAREHSPVNFCQASRFQNGDLDFDGIPYQKGKWPDGSKNVPTSIRYAGPFDAAGQPYPSVQFETDVAGSEFLCNIFTGLNCDAPPLAAKFYPYWTMTKAVGQGIGSQFTAPDCIWNFGATIPGVTKFTFGGDAEYGVSDTSVFGGTLISNVRANPEVNPKYGCRPLSIPAPSPVR
jgi:hypothetical protein